MKIKNVTTFKELFKYLIYFLLFYLCATAKIHPKMLGVALGLYVALIYCRCNILILTPLFISACLIVDSSIGGIIYAIAPVVVLAIAKFVHYKVKKPMRIFACNIYALLSLLLCLFDCFLNKSWGYLLLSILANQIFTYFAIIVCYAVLVRGVATKFSVDEVASAVIIVAVMSIGLYNINIFGFRPYYLVLGFVTMYAIYTCKLSGAMVASLAIALGGAVACKSIALCGGVAIMCLVSATFSKTNVWIVASAVVLSDTLCGVFFGSYPDYNFLHIIAISVGSFSFAFIPKKVKGKFLIFCRKDNATTTMQLSNRLKNQLSQRLSLVASVFYEMADCYCCVGSAKMQTNSAVPQLSSELMQLTCNKCYNRSACFASLGMPTSALFDDVIATALTTQRATLVDLPNFINGHCVNIQILLQNCNSLVSTYQKKNQGLQKINKEQDFIASQFAGISSILSQLSIQVKSEISINQNVQDQIMQNLGYNNIVCSEVTITSTSGNYDVSLIIRKEDENKKALVQVVSKIIGAELIKETDISSLDANRSCIFLCNKPKYDIAFYTCGRPKNDNAQSGDCFNIERLRHNKTMIAICDGMGNGDRAHQHSQTTLQLISKFYRAGFDNSQSLNIVNRLLSISSQDSFSALDMCVVDLTNGMCDFIKLGGVDSIIKKSDRTIIIKSQALPIGIIDDAMPQVQRVMLEVGDIVTLCSDGIMDCLTESGLEYILSKIGSLNPTLIANEIMQQAKLRGLNDDASVVVFRIFCT